MNFNYSIDIFFAIDILINFNSAIVNEKFELIESRKEIAKIYIGSWFIIDLLSIVPFDLIVMGNGEEDQNGSKVN